MTTKEEVTSLIQGLEKSYEEREALDRKIKDSAEKLKSILRDRAETDLKSLIAEGMEPSLISNREVRFRAWILKNWPGTAEHSERVMLVTNGNMKFWLVTRKQDQRTGREYTDWISEYDINTLRGISEVWSLLNQPSPVI